MANLTESPIYEPGIFQLEKTTPPLGGAPAFNGTNPSAGHANVQGLQLANRTNYLNVNKSDKSDLANSTDPLKGASLIGYDGENVASALSYNKTLTNYAALRAYTGTATVVRLLALGIAGTFYYDSTDTSSIDNGGTIIVGSDGRRWKRYNDGVINIRWFSATESSDCTAHLISAKAVGIPYIPDGNFFATPSSSAMVELGKFLGGIISDGKLNIIPPTGVTNFTQPIVHTKRNITITGQPLTGRSLTSFVSATGSARDWTVTVTLSTASGVVQGDYIAIRADVTGSGDFYTLAGAWEVTNVSGNNVSFKHTHYASTFPTLTVTGGGVLILKTVFKFTGCDGFQIRGGETPGDVDGLAIVGDYNIANNTGTLGCIGWLAASPTNANGANTNASFDTGGNSRLGVNSVALCKWGEHGCVVSQRGSLVTNYASFCSNRKRGLYSEGSHIRSKLSIASGNGEDGFISDTVGMIQASLSIASGNGLNGFWSTNLSLIVADRCIASSNSAHGFESRGQTRLNVGGSLSLNNAGRGYSASYGGSIYAGTACSALGNSLEGFYAIGGGSNVQVLNSSSVNNGTYGVRAQRSSYIDISGSGTVSGNVTSNYSSELDSFLLNVSGGIVPTTSKAQSDINIINPTTSAGVKVASSSIGDITWSFDTSGGGSYVNRWVMKADGIIYPSSDNSWDIGRTANRVKSTYSRNFVPGSGTAIWTSGSGTPNGSVTAVIGSIYTDTSGSAGSVLYVKESGTGNTGWVAK